MAQVYNLSVSDNLGEWRSRQHLKLTGQFQERISRLQNPTHCSEAKKILCDLNKACGFGCQMHHVMYCFITSFFLNRTMILESSGWRYNQQGYGAYFKPISNTCASTTSGEKTVGWNGLWDKEIKTRTIPDKTLIWHDILLIIVYKAIFVLTN